jgi:hypothetical protein
MTHLKELIFNFFKEKTQISANLSTLCRVLETRSCGFNLETKKAPQNQKK